MIDAKGISDCNDLFRYGVTDSGLYFIGGQSVYCDMENDGGGWEVMMRRSDGDEEFEQQKWKNYEDGFGSKTSKTSSFWHGNTKMHSLAHPKRYKSLLINIVLANNTKYYAFYETFQIFNQHTQYTLNVGGYSGM